MLLEEEEEMIPKTSSDTNSPRSAGSTGKSSPLNKKPPPQISKMFERLGSKADQGVSPMQRRGSSQNKAVEKPENKIQKYTLVFCTNKES